MSPAGLLLRIAPLPVALAAVLALLATASGVDDQTERVSLATDGGEANAQSLSPALSGDGRYVAFESDASDLVAGDTNGRDIFVHDRETGTTARVNVASDGSQADNIGQYPDISDDGRYVAFSSPAQNLVPGDTNGQDDVFVHDRQTGTTERVSLGPGGLEANDASITPSISGDGRYVAFTSRATNLVAGDENDDWDVFVHDRATGTTELVSQASDGTPGDHSSGWFGAGRGRISADGRYVVFGSLASNLVPGDENLVDDVFLRDRMLGTTERVSVATDGTEGNGHSTYPDVSDEGRYVVYQSDAGNLTEDDTNSTSDVFLHDRQAGTTTLVSHAFGGGAATGASQFPRISGDGTTVVLEAPALDLVPDDTNLWRDVFSYDVASGTIALVSLGPDGVQGDGNSSSAAAGDTGATIAFHSFAPNLVDGDENGVPDVFVRGKSLAPPTPTPTATATPTPQVAAGDANCDGSVNSIDAAVVLQFVAALLGALPCSAGADANADGVTSAIDATVILQFVAGLLPALPP